MPKYLTTDQESPLILDKGKLYFMDFKITNAEITRNNYHTLVRQIEEALPPYIRGYSGHNISDVIVTPIWLSDQETPLSLSGSYDFGRSSRIFPSENQLDYIRVYFRPNPLPIAALVYGVIAVSVLISSAYLVSELNLVFQGIGSAAANIVETTADLGKEVINKPEAIIKAIGKNWFGVTILVLTVLGVFFTWKSLK